MRFIPVMLPFAVAGCGVSPWSSPSLQESISARFTPQMSAADFSAAHAMLLDVVAERRKRREEIFEASLGSLDSEARMKVTSAVTAFESQPRFDRNALDAKFGAGDPAWAFDYVCEVSNEEAANDPRFRDAAAVAWRSIDPSDRTSETLAEWVFNYTLLKPKSRSVAVESVERYYAYRTSRVAPEPDYTSEEDQAAKAFLTRKDRLEIDRRSRPGSEK